MRSARALTLGCLAAAALAAGARSWAEETALVRGLVRNAWYWQARGLPEKAEEAWKEVLAADRDNGDALAALGVADARAGRLAQARERLAHLERVNPGHPDLPVLRRAVDLGPRLDPMLAEARRLVHQGRVEEGVARYRELFGSAGPPGDLALEYYETVGGSAGGWEQARDGLRRLVRRAPAEARFRLALAKLLTYREETRREGIQALASLARNPVVAKEADAAWRKAVGWLTPAPADMALLRAYAEAHPGDAETARRLERNRRAGSTRSGYAALERGDLRAAERLFDASGDDPEARTGLAIVAQRDAAAARKRQDLGRARELLERSRRLAPDRPDLWQEALRDVAFWQLMQEASAARRRRDDAAAEAKLTQALDAAPLSQRWHADMALGELYLARGDRQKAEAHYRDVLAAARDQPDALRALASLLVDDGRFEEALVVNDRLSQVAPERAFRQGYLRAEAHRARAARSRAAHDLADARRELTAARDADPGNVWVLHDLANVLLEAGAVADAAPVVAALQRAAPGLPAAAATQARLLAARKENARALAVLRALPPDAQDRSTTSLRRQLEVEVRAPAAVRLAAQGRKRAAAEELSALQKEVEDVPELAAQVAVAWSRIGENRRAVALMRSAMAAAPGATRGERLQLASALLEAGDDGGVGPLLAGLDRDPSLSAGERRWLTDLRTAHAIRSADRSQTVAEMRDAQAQLEAVLRDAPGDVRLVLAQARLAQRRGDAAQAHALYARALALRADDPDALRGAVDTALATGDLDEARRIADQAADKLPHDARAHLLAARVKERSGDDRAAMSSLERALALSKEQRATRSSEAVREGGTGTSAGQSDAGAGAQPHSAFQAGSEAAPDPALGREIRREMDRLRERHRPELDLLGVGRRREGEPGLSQLTELRQSARAEIPVAMRGRASLAVSEVELDAGSLAPSAASRFGSGPPGRGRAAEGDAQRATGTEIKARYEDPNLVLEASSLPIGFPVQALLGTARLQGAFGALHLGAEGGRRSVRESLLSYAGAKDPATGRPWGGVVTEGGQVDLGLDLGAANLEAYVGADRLVGFRVAENRRALAGARADVFLYRGGAGTISAGVAAAGLGYEHNLRFFTFGHGGYFSPRRFLHAGAPLRWSGDGKVRWELAAEPGLDTYEEASAPVFPLGGVGEQPAPYPGSTKRGFSFNGRAMLGVPIGRGFETSLDVAGQGAPEYRDLRAAVVLRYASPPGGE